MDRTLAAKRSAVVFLRPASSSLTTYLVVRVAVLVAVLMAHQAQPSYSLSHLPAAWDGAWYIRIAKHGYPHDIGASYNAIAFFPLMPMLIWTAHSIALGTLDWSASASAVSLLFGGLLVLIGARLAAEVYGQTRGSQAGMVLGSFPGLFIAGMGYADPLAAALAALSLLWLVHARRNAAGLAAALATVASPVMLPLLGVFLWDIWHSGRRAIVPLVLAISGISIWLGSLWLWTGNPSAWLAAERPWGHQITVPWKAGTWRTLMTVVPDHGIFWMTLGACLALCVMLWGSTRIGLPRAWWIYGGLTIGIIVCDTSLWLNPRFLLSAFPILLGAGAALPRKWLIPVLLLNTGLSACTFLAYTLYGNTFAQP